MLKVEVYLFKVIFTFCTICDRNVVSGLWIRRHLLLPWLIGGFFCC